jgi:hypothetical protein
MLDTGSCRPVDSDCSMLEDDHLGLIIQISTVDETPTHFEEVKCEFARLVNLLLL